MKHCCFFFCFLYTNRLILHRQQAEGSFIRSSREQTFQVLQMERQCKIQSRFCALNSANLPKLNLILVHLKPSNTPRQKLVHPKYKVPRHKQSNVLYAVQCSRWRLVGSMRQLKHLIPDSAFYSIHIPSAHKRYMTFTVAMTTSGYCHQHILASLAIKQFITHKIAILNSYQ